MSFSRISAIALGTGAAAAGAALPVLNPNAATIPAGSLVVIGWVADVAALTVASVSDNTGGPNLWNTATAPLSGTTLSLGFVWCMAPVPMPVTTNITVTLSASNTRKACWIDAWTPTNGNVAIDKTATAVSSTASPVTTGTTATLGATDDLLIGIQGWLGGAVASGYAHSSPAGFTGGVTTSISGGTTTRTECRYSFKDNAGASTGWAESSTFTSITRAHAFALSFIDLDPVKRRQLVVRRSWAGR